MFRIRFEGSVRVDRSDIRREGIPYRMASMPKTTTDESNVGTKMGEKMKGGRVKLKRWSVGVLSR